MRPWCVVGDEALKELRGGDRACVAPAGILHVGEFGIDQLVVIGAERHAPYPLARRGACLQQALRQPLVVREQSGMLVAERHQDRARQSRKIDDEFRLEPVLDVPQEVGEHEPALRVGIDDLDGLAGHRGHDVAGTLGLAVRHVFDEADHADGVDGGLAGGERPHQADHAGSPRHVALHVLHAGGRLDRDAAGVETHSLAHEGDRRGARLAAVEPHDHDPAFACRALADREQRAHAELLQRRLVQHFDRDPELFQARRAAGKLLGMEHVRRLVDEVPRQHDASA